MIVLASTSDKIQVITESSSSVVVHASWLDSLAGAVTPGRTNTAAITGTTTTDVVAPPASSTYRTVKFLSVLNDHASTSNLVTIQHTDGSNVEPLWKGTLLAGESVTFTEGNGWTYLDASGQVKAGSTVKLDVFKRVPIDLALTGVAAVARCIPALTVDLKPNKAYVVTAHIFHISSASTVGANFGVMVDSNVTLLAGNISGVTNSVTGGTISLGTTTTVNGIITAQTTGSANNTMTIISAAVTVGSLSLPTTVGIGASAETSAGTLTILAGSWLRVRELDN